MYTVCEYSLNMWVHVHVCLYSRILNSSQYTLLSITIHTCTVCI